MEKNIKGKKGITLVSLVVTIIILIIIAGISINMTLGEEGIITIAKKAKENMELAQIEEQTKLNELYMQIEQENGDLGDINIGCLEKINEFKRKIAEYIEEAGGIKPEPPETVGIETFRESILGIVKEVTKDATATAEDIAEGKTAWVNGEKIVGNKKDEMSSIKDILYGGTKNSLSYTWTGTTSGSLSNSNNYSERTQNYSGTSLNIPIIQNDAILTNIIVPVNRMATNSYGYSNVTVELYDGNNTLLGTVANSNPSKFSVSEFNRIDTDYLYLKFKAVLHVRQTSYNSTKTDVSFSINNVQCIYRSK